MALPFVKLAKEAADVYRQLILDYNSTAVAEGAGPSKWDLIKEGERLAEEGQDKSAVDAKSVLDRAQTALNKARAGLAVIGAASLGVEFDADKAEATDEAKDEAKTARKELVAVLKMLADTGEQVYAHAFEIPNVGSDRVTVLGTAGTSRLRLWVDVAGPDDFSERFKSLSDLKLASNSKTHVVPDGVDVDKIRAHYESQDEAAQKEGVAAEFADGWTVTVSPK